MNRDEEYEATAREDEECDECECQEWPEVGDVVYLNSGSPPMVVVDTMDECTRVLVNWMNIEQEVMEAEFPTRAVSLE